jgi:hypothetical protein
MMATIKLPFIGGAYKDENSSVDAQECTNLMLEPDEHGGRPALYGTPGLEQFVDLTV